MTQADIFIQLGWLEDAKCSYPYSRTLSIPFTGSCVKAMELVRRGQPLHRSLLDLF